MEPPLQTCKQFQQQPRCQREWRADDENGEGNTQDDHEQRRRIERQPTQSPRLADAGRERRHRPVCRGATLEPGVASNAPTSVAWSTWATVLVACALRHVISDTVAPPIMNTAMKANVDGDRTDGTAHSHNAATHEADTLSAARTARSREAELVKANTFRMDQHLVN
jgi:hypothetical protein